MARIRRFVVSQVEGNDAEATNLDEIRPYGEIGLFEGEYNNSINDDRLELLIFDGNRTHLRSKVLSPGRFYGYDADSGDGLNRDTIKLIPDAELYYNGGSYGNDQYLVIDPTGGEPGHIHVRAGGNIDQSGADLFLGGETNHVRVSDVGDYVRISVDNNQPGTYEWTFDASGNLNFPGFTSRIGESEPGLVVFSDNGFAVLTDANGDSKSWIFGSDGNLTTSSNLVIGLIPGAGTIIVQDDAPLAVISANANGYAVMGWGESANSPGNIATISFNSPAVFGGAANVSITTGNNGGTQYDWVFGNDGNTTIPGGIVSGANITVTVGANSFILDTDGGLYVPGDLDVTGISVSNVGITFGDSSVQTTAWTGSDYGDSNVSSLLGTFGSNTISTTGNVTVGNLLTAAGGDVILGNATSNLQQAGSNASVNLSANITLTPDTAQWAGNGVLIGGNGFLLGPNGSRNAQLNYNNTNGLMGFPRINLYGSEATAIAQGGTSGTGNIGASGSRFNTLYAVGGDFTGNVAVGGILKITDGVHETVQAKADATGTVTHDCSSGQIFYHTSPDANWTVNLTNLNLDSGFATTVTLVIVQGVTGYYPSALQISGAGQTINWQGNATPAPSSSRTDVVSFSIINNSGTYTVLGQLTGF